MNSARYRITTAVEGISKSQIWDAKKPLKLGTPVRWVLVNTKDGIKLTDSKGRPLPLDLVNGDPTKPVELKNAETKKSVSLRIQPLQSVRPAYRSPAADAPGKVQQLFTFSGVRGMMVESSPIHSAYVATFRKKPVFTVFDDGKNALIKPLLDDVRLRLRGKEIAAQPGQAWKLTHEELMLCTVFRGWYWWKFNQVKLGEALAVESPEEENETAWLKRIGLFITLAVLGIFGASYLFSPTQEPPKEEPLPPVVRVKSLKQKAPGKMIPAEKPMVSNVDDGHEKPIVQGNPNADKTKTPGGHAAKVPNKPVDPKAMEAANKLKEEKRAAAAQAAKEKAEAQAQARADAAKKRAEAQAEAREAARIRAEERAAEMKRQAEERAAARAAAKAKAEAEAAARAAAAKAAGERAAAAKAQSQLAALASLTGGNAKGGGLADAEASANGSGGSEVFSQGGSGLSAPKISGGGYGGSKSQVSGIGGVGGGDGSGKGVGYGSGEYGQVKGQGNSFIDAGFGGGTVEEGLTQEEVAAVIRAHMAEIRYCHEASMVRNPKVEGNLILQFSINAGGRVISASPKTSTIPEKELPQCVISHLKTWDFPHPKGGVTVKVVYPFVFKTLGRGR